ncbi:calcium-binding protein [Cyanothece sp. BG0011]|uniref:calcium-binding protein n=1 Tax=Cyanothece sp. BG0011 TaxID=2082950 RepID=UPI000D1E34EC|nr:calcium-binding protein [Cyanothece sp. BG0011]
MITSPAQFVTSVLGIDPNTVAREVVALGGLNNETALENYALYLKESLDNYWSQDNAKLVVVAKPNDKYSVLELSKNNFSVEENKDLDDVLNKYPKNEQTNRNVVSSGDSDTFGTRVFIKEADSDNFNIVDAKAIWAGGLKGFQRNDTGLKYKTYSLILNEARVKNSASIRAIATSLMAYKRAEGVGYSETFVVEDKRSGYEKVYDEATTQRGLYSDYPNGKSINHILADSAISNILHTLAAQAISNGWSDAAIEANVKPFLDALDNIKLRDQGGSLSDKALGAFKNAVKDGKFNGTELHKAISTISYAPGNVRWGDSTTNTKISNFFDPIFENDNGTIKLEDSTQKIYDAVSQLKKDGLITEEQFELATKLAGSEENKTVLTSSRLKGHYYPNPLFFDPVLEVVQNSDSRRIKVSFTLYPVEDSSTSTHLTEILKANNRSNDSTVEEPKSGVDKDTKRIDYEVIHTSISDEGDKLTVYKIIDPNGGEPQYRVQIDIGGDESKRISIFSSENPVQADGSIRLPDTTTIISHGEKLEGQTYTSEVENSYLGQDDKYIKIGANDFRNVENLEAAEHKPANSTNNVYLLEKYRGKEEGLGIDMAKNQEQVLLTTLRDRSANGKANMGYMTVGKRSKVTSQDAEAALSRLGTKSVVSGYCRACATVDNAETYRAKVKESAKATHLDGEKLFANNIRQTIEDVAIVRNTNLEGRRNVSIKQLVKDAESIGGQIKRKAFQTAPQLTFTGMKYVDGQYQDTHGNLQVQVGDGEFTAAFWGNTNIGIKVGDGGFKAAAFGDNNIFVHIGDGDTAKHTQTIANYTAFEGAQLFIGQRNVSFNYGVSNDFIVMVDKSIPLPPFQSPFSGPTDIVGYLKEDIAQFNVNGDKDDIDPLTGDPIEDNYYDSQNYLWSKGNAKQIIDQISTLDMNSSVEYETVFDYGSESDRNTRALQADAERALNKGFNRVMAGQSPFKKAQGTPLKDQNFNLTIAGQGADIILTNGDNQFMFADNIPSLLDTTIASVFGMLSQETNAENGQVGNTLSYDPRNALGNFLNQLIARVSASLPDLTLGEALGLTYDAQGNITKTEAQRLSQEDLDSIRDAFAQFVSQNGQKVGLDLKNEETGANFDITNPSNLLGLFEAFGNGNLSKFIDPDGLVDSLKSALDIGEDGLKSFQNYFAPQEETEETENSSTTETPESDNPSPPAVPVIESSEVFGFGGLTLPSVFDIDIPQLFSTKTLDDMVGLVNSFDGDIDTMQEQMFDFFANSGYMTGDGDLLVSLGNNNLTWGGDGNDLVGLMGLNNNFWGGDGDDLYYGMGENNQGSGNKGDDTAVLIGINNLFFGGEGHDFALAAGRYANLSGGDGDDTLYVLGSDSWLNGGEGENYLVAVGNYNAVVSGDGNDYIVSIGNYGDVESGAGQDVVTVFGNKNTIKTGADDDYLRIMGHQGEVFAGAGDDFIWTDVEAKDNVIKGDIGNDTFVLGGSNNIYYSGEGKDSFIISDNYQNAVIKDITVDDLLMFADVADNELWFKQEEDDLLIYLQQTPNNEGDELTHSTLTIEDYFNNQQANIVLDTGLVSDSGEAAYEILTQQGLGSLINIMSQYDVVGSTDAFLDNVSDEDLEKLAIAWDKTSIV